MKSIVVQIKEKQAIILESDGTFRKIEDKGYQVGQELRTARTPLLRRASTIAAAAVLLLSGGTALAYYTPVSYASVDINPSIEFQINLIGHVISVRGVNEDGQTLLTHIKTGVNLGRNIQAVVREAAAEGYLKPDAENTVVVTIASNNDSQAQQDSEQAQEQAEEALKAAGTPGEVEVDRVGYDRVQEARKLGTTPGKLNLVQKYIESTGGDSAQVDVNEWLKKPVKDIMKAIKANKKATKSAQPDASATPSATASATATETTSADPSATASATDSASGTPAASLSPAPTATPRDDGNNGKGNDDKEVNDKGNTGMGLLDSHKPEKTPKPTVTPKPTKAAKPTKTLKPTETQAAPFRRIDRPYWSHRFYWNDQSTVNNNGHDGR